MQGSWSYLSSQGQLFFYFFIYLGEFSAFSTLPEEEVLDHLAHGSSIRVSYGMMVLPYQQGKETEDLIPPPGGDHHHHQMISVHISLSLVGAC